MKKIDKYGMILISIYQITIISTHLHLVGRVSETQPHMGENYKLNNFAVKWKIYIYIYMYIYINI